MLFCLLDSLQMAGILFAALIPFVFLFIILDLLIK